MHVKKKVNFAIVQMSMKIKDKKANISKAERMIDNAVKKHNADIVGLPEIFFTEFFPISMDKDRKFFAYAEPIPGPTIERIAKKAIEHDIHILTPIYEEVEKGICYNSVAVIGPKGNVLGVTRKVEIPNVHWPEAKVVADEKFYYGSGTEFPVVETCCGKIATIICWNRHFPEQWRIYGLKGAEIIFIPVATIGRMNEMFTIETQSSTYQNQLYAVVVNRVGMENKCDFFGGSHVVGPLGEIIAGPLRREEKVLCATLDLDKIAYARNSLPYYRDRKPELYGLIATPHSILADEKIEKLTYGEKGKKNKA